MKKHWQYFYKGAGIVGFCFAVIGGVVGGMALIVMMGLWIARHHHGPIALVVLGLLALCYAAGRVFESSTGNTIFIHKG